MLSGEQEGALRWSWITSLAMLIGLAQSPAHAQVKPQVEERAGPSESGPGHRPVIVRSAEGAPSTGSARLKGGVEMVSIQGGRFRMGSASGDEDERPVRRVRIKPFLISKAEVTVAQYQACVDAGACDTRDLTYMGACNWGQPDRKDHPINCVSWHQARTFARWAGGRLPTEAEWEYVARSRGKSRKYPWGHQKPTCARAVMSEGGYGCGGGSTQAVCSKPEGHSAQGLCDLAGNVQEWVEDVHANYKGAPSNGTAQVEGGTNRVFRGGGWIDTEEVLRTTFRNANQPDERDSNVGFRIAASPP